jgi:hypothetical protein
VELADKAEALVDKARALERVGRPLLAAQAYERAAEQAATAKPPDEEHAAALFERAYRLYDDLFEEERVAACRRQMQRYYRLPEIVVQGHAESAFIEYEWNTLHLEVENSGYGPARRIAIEFGNLFQAKEEVCLRGLRSQKAQSLRAYVRSKKGQYGPTVPLDIRVTYEDLRGERHQLTDCIPVRVVQQGIIPGITTPVQIQIGEMYQPGARKEVGDRLRMDIQRTEGRHVTLEEGASDSRISVRRNAELVRRCPTCNVPIQAEDHRFCPDCGARLVEDC